MIASLVEGASWNGGIKFVAGSDSNLAGMNSTVNRVLHVAFAGLEVPGYPASHCLNASKATTATAFDTFKLRTCWRMGIRNVRSALA